MRIFVALISCIMERRYFFVGLLKHVHLSRDQITAKFCITSHFKLLDVYILFSFLCYFYHCMWLVISRASCRFLRSVSLIKALKILYSIILMRNQYKRTRARSSYWDKQTPSVCKVHLFLRYLDYIQTKTVYWMVNDRNLRSTSLKEQTSPNVNLLPKQTANPNPNLFKTEERSL